MTHYLPKIAGVAVGSWSVQEYDNRPLSIGTDMDRAAGAGCNCGARALAQKNISFPLLSLPRSTFRSTISHSTLLDSTVGEVWDDLGVGMQSGVDVVPEDAATLFRQRDSVGKLGERGSKLVRRRTAILISAVRNVIGFEAPKIKCARELRATFMLTFTKRLM